jgi:hypothetical protein
MAEHWGLRYGLSVPDVGAAYDESASESERYGDALDVQSVLLSHEP